MLSLHLHGILQTCILLLELMGLATIVLHCASTCYGLFRRKTAKTTASMEFRLLNGLSLGLTFFLAAEILLTATIRSFGDFYLIALIVLIRTAISLFLRWSTTNPVSSAAIRDQAAAEPTAKTASNQSLHPGPLDRPGHDAGQRVQ